MSAYLCDDSHISFLAGYAVTVGLWRPDPDALLEMNSFDRSDAEVLAGRLHSANCTSLMARYGNRAGELIGDIDGFKFDRAAASRAKVLTVSPVQVIKSARCFAYQVCEYDGWEASPENAVIQAIIANAIPKLPGYDAASWGAPD